MSTKPATVPAPAQTLRRAMAYDRRRDLAPMFPIWPHEIDDTTSAGTTLIISRLRTALVVERQRGLLGHHAYSLPRHEALLKAYRAECAALDALTGAETRGQLVPARAA